MVRTGSGMSKWVPARLAMASSARFCIQALSSSVPCSWYAGSASRAAMASLTVLPGLIRSATCSISAVIRSTSCWPHA